MGWARCQGVARLCQVVSCWLGKVVAQIRQPCPRTAWSRPSWSRPACRRTRWLLRPLRRRRRRHLSSRLTTNSTLWTRSQTRDGAWGYDSTWSSEWATKLIRIYGSQWSISSTAQSCIHTYDKLRQKMNEEMLLEMLTWARVNREKRHAKRLS